MSNALETTTNAALMIMSEILCEARLLEHHKTLLPSGRSLDAEDIAEWCLEVLNMKSEVKAFRFVRSVLLLNNKLN